MVHSATLVAWFFSTPQLLARAVECGLKAEGTFVAINNGVSQIVPHLHVHIVPRRKGDGLKGILLAATPLQRSGDAFGKYKYPPVGHQPNFIRVRLRSIWRWGNPPNPRKNPQTQ